jgi:hypothetical protein
MSLSSAHRRSVALSSAALLGSLGTLVCCVLPAVLVALGAGAALAGLVTAVPQLVWLSEHKPLVFGVAALLLAASGLALANARGLPCPVEAGAAQWCRRLRRLSTVLYGIGLGSFAVGGLFAFVLPRLMP